MSAALAGLDAALTTSEARQRRFLLSVSHELRTPLTTIRGYAEGAGRRCRAGRDETAAVGRTLVEEADRMERYVVDLLALARLEAADFSLDVDEVDVPTRRCADGGRPGRPSRAGRVSVEPPGAAPGAG